MTSTSVGYTELAPRYTLPLLFLGLAGALFWLIPWLAAIFGVLGLFLGIQTATLRLRFTDSALDIYRGDRCIRHFPYQDWRHWRIFWEKSPILLYFREINSIHFLPILFNAKELQACLERHCSC